MTEVAKAERGRPSLPIRYWHSISNSLIGLFPMNEALPRIYRDTRSRNVGHPDRQPPKSYLVFES